MDLDKFKNINDTYGHPFGDVVLAKVSETIQKTLRPVDYVIRYGGEEFIAVVQSDAGVKPFDIAERVRLAVEKLSIRNEKQGVDIRMTISIGISTYVLGSTPAAMIEQADKAMYESKKERNKTTLFTPEMSQDS